MAYGLTSTNTVMSLFNRHLQKRSEKTLFATPRLYELASKHPLPGGAGKTIFIPRHIAKNTGGELTEQTIITPSATSAHYYSATVKGYGDAKAYSDFLVMVHEIPTMISDDIAGMTQYAGQWVDGELKTALCAVGNWVSPNGSTTNGGVLDETVMKQRFLFDASTKLASLYCPTYSDGNYAGVFHPQQIHDLFISTSAGSQMGTYAFGAQSFLEGTESGAEKLAKMTISVLGRVRIIESTHSAKDLFGAGGVSAENSGWAAYVMGPGAVGAVDLTTAKLKTYIKGLGEGGVYDPIDQKKTAGIKLYFAACAMDTTNRLVRTASGQLT